MGISFWQIAIVVVIVVLLFGRGKISSLMGDVAKGIKSFKKGMSDDTSSNNENNKTNSDNPDSEKINNKNAANWLVRDYNSCRNCYFDFRSKRIPYSS